MIFQFYIRPKQLMKTASKDTPIFPMVLRWPYLVQLKAVPGSNPEQLIGLALSTCLNATLEAIEKEHGQTHQSKVVTTVKMSRDRFGYQFFLDARVTIPEVDAETAARWLAIAETRCPVAKLVGPSANVTIQLA